MAKRKITVTVDEALVDYVREESQDSVSAVVNAALTNHVDRLRRRAALADLLAEWDATYGSIGAAAAAAAAAAFDEADGLAPGETTSAA